MSVRESFWFEGQSKKSSRASVADILRAPWVVLAGDEEESGGDEEAASGEEEESSAEGDEGKKDEGVICEYTGVMC